MQTKKGCQRISTQEKNGVHAFIQSEIKDSVGLAGPLEPQKLFLIDSVLPVTAQSMLFSPQKILFSVTPPTWVVAVDGWTMLGST
jgi:hypothetical protein